MRTQVLIVGGGPAGLLLSEMLHSHAIDSVVLERSSREHVLSRIRAGVLEQTTVDLLRAHGLAERMDREGHPHDGMRIVWAGRDGFFIDVAGHVGKRFMTYGQTQIQEDLFAAADRRGATVLTEVTDVGLMHVESEQPCVTFSQHGETARVDCDFIAGCDGFHGVTHAAIARALLREFEKVYPFGWLGVLSPTPPLPDIVYASHPRGFALASARNPRLSRYYIQVPLETKIEDWSDDRFWAEAEGALPAGACRRHCHGHVNREVDRPLRSYVAEPMRYGRLFLAGDAAHIVPPTGAKGLNLAVSDVFYLARALAAFYARKSATLLDCYSEMALRRVWAAVHLSWYLTSLLHRFPDASEFDRRAQEVELAYLKSSHHAQVALAEQYAGLPFELAT